MNKEVVLIFLLYLFVVSIGVFGVIHAKNVDQEYRYLLISPSYFNDTTLNWTTSVWAGVLGIHGTIAALSITFMGMFVAQVSSYSEHGFEEICKSILLQKTKFLRFSMNSVLSLLSGIVLIACGGGIITYAISIFVSLCFILSYGSMYLKLYNVTETPTIISDYLFLALQKCRARYTLLNKSRDELTNQFTETLNELEHFTFKWSYDFINNDHYDLNVFSDKNNEIIKGFCATCFKNLNNDLKKLSDEDEINIQLSVSFMYPLSTSRIQVTVKKDTLISEETIHKIASSLKKGMFFSSIPEELLMYKKYEEALILNIRNSLLNGNEWGLNFGVKAVFILADELNLVKLVQNLSHSFGYTNKKNNVDPSIFAAFYEKVSIEVRSFENLELASQSLRGIINLARYLFTSDYFYDFYKLISPSLEHRAKYSLGDEGYCFFDLYSETVRDNILSKNYKAFELNTRFLTDEFRYLESSDDGQSLSVIETKMLICVKEILTLLIIRLRFLSDKPDVHKDEIETINECISHWLESAFIEDIYYKEGTYDVLFKIPSEPDFDASRVLRDIPDYKVSSVSISNDTYIAIALLMTQSSFNKNNLNTIFIRNKKDFLENTEITTDQLQSIITYLKSDSFSDLMNLIKIDSSKNTNRLKIAEHLESIIAVKNETINEFIANSELDGDLIEKYKLKASMALDKFFSRIVDIHSIPNAEAIICPPFYSLIYKREVMQSIDRVHFSMNSAHHAEVHFFSWLHKILDEIKNKQINIIEIDNPKKLPSDRLVTIQYMVEGEQSIYQHSKGLRIKNTKGTLGLGKPGLYYMDFENSFKCVKNPNLFNINIERISQDNISFVQDMYDFKGENAFLYALMSTRINLKLINTDNLSLYYISVDTCKKLTAFNEQTTRLSLNDQKSLEELDDFS
ncbi:hypothetical protein KZN43_003746 [Escherichia coli]|nr:hypothetical protein [Escherichia coli]